MGSGMRRMTRGKSASRGTRSAPREPRGAQCFAEMCGRREWSASPLNVISKVHFVDSTQRKLTMNGFYFVLVIFYKLNVFGGEVQTYGRSFSLLHSDTVGGGVCLQLPGNHKKN